MEQEKKEEERIQKLYLFIGLGVDVLHVCMGIVICSLMHDGGCKTARHLRKNLSFWLSTPRRGRGRGVLRGHHANSQVDEGDWCSRGGKG